MAFAPGTEEVRELFLLRRGEPMRCWCACHWAATFGGPDKARRGGCEHEGGEIHGTGT